MDHSVLWKLSYGLYAIGTLDDKRDTGCIVNTVIQITSENPVIAISMNKNNFTYEAIERTGKFSISILSEKTNQNVIAKLGFCSGRDVDKFDGTFEYMYLDGLPVIKENAAGYLVANVMSTQETPTHFVILARVSNTLKGIDIPPMTYQYYHEVIKGKAPKNAPTYREEVVQDKYVCDTCGYVYDGDISKEADDFVCPICKQAKSHFHLK